MNDSDVLSGDRKASMIEDARWVKDKKGVKRLKIESVDKDTFATRRKEQPGWRNGARIRRP